MQRTSFREMACSIARTLDVIGEPWSPLILRDVWVGMNRFDEIQADLGISRKVLTERLNHLVEHGVLERRPYDRRPRYEYHLTEKGRDLFPVAFMLMQWGDRWLAPGYGGNLRVRHKECGWLVRGVVSCGRCGEPLRAHEVNIPVRRSRRALTAHAVRARSEATWSN